MVYLIARDTYKISLREGDNRRSHPGPLRENVTICPTQACTTPLRKSGEVAGNMPFVRLVDDDCMAALLVKAHTRPGPVAHGGPGGEGRRHDSCSVRCPSEPRQARWGSAGLAYTLSIVTCGKVL